MNFTRLQVTRQSGRGALDRHAPRKPLKQRGQGMTEYIIIVALIAVAAIATYRFFGKTARQQTAGIAQEVSGQSATTAITASQASANQATGQANQNKGLDTYNSK